MTILTAYACFTVVSSLLIPQSDVSQSDGNRPLAERVRNELETLYYDGGPPLDVRLLKLGRSEAISPILIDLLRNYKTVRPNTPDFGDLTASIFALGKLRAILAIPLLKEIASCRECWNETEYHGIRIYAVQSVGEIDPNGNRDFLLAALKDDYYAVRKVAADGLSRTNDSKVLQELDVQASRETNRMGALEIQGLADKLRARIQLKK